MKLSVDKQKLKVNHYDPERFHRSEWSDPGIKSWKYVLYRCCMAALFVGGVLWHVLHTRETLSAKWLIYMTNQGITLLTLHYVLYAVLVVANHFRSTPRSDTSLPFVYKISWALQNMSFTAALFISIVYWSALYPLAVKANRSVTPLGMFLNVFLHGLNSVSCLIDIFVTARPIRVLHFYIPMIFGLYYVTFSLIYWAAGGTGRCAVRTNCTLTSSAASTTTTTIGSELMANLPLEEGPDLLEHLEAVTDDPNCGEVICDKFIYPILDWEDHPGIAVGMLFLGIVAIPLLQMFWWSLFRLRNMLSRRFGSQRFGYEMK